MTTNAKVTQTVNYSQVVGAANSVGAITTASNGISSCYIQPAPYTINGGTSVPYVPPLPYAITTTSSTFTDAVSKGGFPVHNLIETADNYIVELALAGWKKKDITIEVSDKELLVSGESTSNHPFPQEAYLQRSITRSKFSKTITLGPNIDQDKIEAKYEDGLLTVTIQKRIKIKTVPIKVSIK
jgi:HSP20 family protein